MNIDLTNQQRQTTKRFCRARAVIVALFVLLPLRAFGAEESNTGFRVVQERTGDSVTLIMKSDYTIEFTVTLEAALQNMTPSRPVPFTVDAAGRSSFVLVRFTQTDKTRPWHYDYHYYWELGSRRSTTSNDADYA